MTAPAIAARGVSKSFGGVKALTRASIAVARGSVHALVGENGAGKSTLIKILGGRIAADEGSVETGGPDLRIGTVFQELTLLPYMTVAENLLLGREPRGRLGLIDRAAMPRIAEAELAGLGITHIDPRALAADISLAERQIIEIARVIMARPQILLLDEATSALVEREVAWLFGQIRALRDAGVAIVFTSHRWGEITSIADEITIFRNGTDVGTFTSIGEDEAITLMTGQALETIFPARGAQPPGPVLLSLRGARAEGTAPLDLDLRAGEILGIGGLAGHGHRALFFGLFGAPGFREGRIEREGRPVRITAPWDAIRAGLALVPEDRKSEGLFLPLSVRDNFTLPILRRLSRLGILRLGAERATVAESIRRLAVRTPSAQQPVGALSGGNQQKVLLGRWLLTRSRILLLYDVTRGVDVATKHEIYELIAGLAREGYAILFYSSDAEELAHLCHRVKVMRRGAFVAELPADALSAEAIVAAAMRESGKTEIPHAA
ncbi:MAG TPA: sugar ABC transporter ATP-binding protein [Acidiphilium sp.]|jgi:ribose transport system ATP-binding protein|uniref:sugar ABC transporter ATP-binding protein n=1 Tax=unclassified Acidiphilium TaxID=2617493 RepID=UPI000BD5E8EF|nr:MULTISPECIES: sugar ABC transporter ATP-binding protein [unclassified Acidiphilium]OYV56525.1 MAG: ABC transporter [Acidiphilium sp. 20-67-58]HQT59783.1 sugar ABC transporter ATP-binding protein [Acidiphilium sp.]HQU10841.1 sugar ABC transporter ATP-binding protein [Acidiphilium sp.]